MLHRSHDFHQRQFCLIQDCFQLLIRDLSLLCLCQIEDRPADFTSIGHILFRRIGEEIYLPVFLKEFLFVSEALMQVFVGQRRKAVITAAGIHHVLRYFCIECRFKLRHTMTKQHIIIVLQAVTCERDLLLSQPVKKSSQVPAVKIVIRVSVDSGNAFDLRHVQVIVISEDFDGGSALQSQLRQLTVLPDADFFKLLSVHRQRLCSRISGSRTTASLNV